MAIVLDIPPQARFGDVHARLIDYAIRVEQLRSPDEVLDELNTITRQNLSLSVLGAARLPLKSGDWESIRVGKSAFLHKDVPEGWWEDFNTLVEANSVLCASWRRPAWRPTPGRRSGGCSNPLALSV